MKPQVELKGKRVLVVGLARTGMAAALFCAARGALVTALDQKSEAQLPDVAGYLRDSGVQLRLGKTSPDAFNEAQLIVVSPGVPANLPELVGARKRNVPVWSEIELAWRFLRGKLIAITGSNGKTTTTSLTAHILKTAGVSTLVGGNIGVPLLSLVDSSTDASVTVAEVSSFQLETIEAFRPDIALLLNLTPDHLDRHASFEEYVDAKLRIFENQTEQDFAILNADDAEVISRKPVRAHVLWFSRLKPVAEGAFLQGDDIVLRTGGNEISLIDRGQISLRGEHNVENVLAACTAAYLSGASPGVIAEAVRSFRAVEHRLEFVSDIAGVQYFNDSKATNVDSALKAIEAFPGPLIVILGGKDKGSPYTPLRETLRQRARAALLIGAASDKIAADLKGAVHIERAGTLDRAVEITAKMAKPGDTVLLAPACSSFDQFQNYEERGRVFKTLVAQLRSRVAAGISAQKNSAKG